MLRRDVPSHISRGIIPLITGVTSGSRRRPIWVEDRTRDMDEEYTTITGQYNGGEREIGNRSTGSGARAR